MKIEAAIQKFRKFYADNKRLPTHEEICYIFKFSSKNASFYLVNKLLAAGVIAKDDKGRLTPDGLFKIPQFGLVHAGYPVVADTVHDTSLDLYQYLLDLPGQIFSLVVKGDSMIEAGITDGDIVIIEKDRKPIEGDIIIACLNNDWTLKSFFKDKLTKEVLLVPANGKYEVIRARGTDDLLIGGVVISVIRKYH